MKIGEFSALTGVPIKTIRYYSDIGLLKPHSIDSDSNYRSYKKEQIVTLNRIISLKDAGFMLSDIKMIIDSQITNDDFIKMLVCFFHTQTVVLCILKISEYLCAF